MARPPWKIGSLVALAAVPIAAAAPAEGRRMWRGDEFEGGARDRFGAVHYGELVNYVYARPTGGSSVMRLRMPEIPPPETPLFLHLKARDDNGPGICRIRIVFNDTVLSEGPNAFPSDRWAAARYPIPAAAFRAGDNLLTIENIEDEGRLGMPPWFMVAACAVAPENHDWTPDLAADFAVVLPESIRPLPEPLPPGKEPGFRIRGTKGWMWSPDQYLAEIPVLAKHRMNFLMNCYLSMCDIEHFAWGDPRVNRWWEPLPDGKKADYERVVSACRDAGIDFCFSMNPGLCTEQPIDYASATDLDALWQHYDWMQSLGVRWFNLALDDIQVGIDASGQARLVNALFDRLRRRDPGARMIFCPTYYWGDGSGEPQASYLAVLARELHPDVYLFWTGDAVVGPITRRGAERYRAAAGRRLILWDNYPVNDNAPTMHLGPVIGRDPDLCEVVDGYMSNPMCSQNEANRIPLLTCADYAYNPWNYDPARSIGQAILHLADTPGARRTLADLVDAYPGMLFHSAGPSFNAVWDRHARLAAIPHARFLRTLHLRHLEDLHARLEEHFPGRLSAAKVTLADDIRRLRGADPDPAPAP